MTDIIKLAEFLFQMAASSGVQTTMRRCIHILRHTRGVTSETVILRNLQLLLNKLKKAPIYTVDGMQDKVWYGDTLVKYDGVVGHPHGLVEHTVSRALDYCSVSSEPILHVKYDSCVLEGKVGCKCIKYSRPDEHEQSFWDIDGAESLQTLSKTGLVRDLAIMFLCDYLFFNPDRHKGNIIVLTGRGVSRLAPVFDMGNSLLFVDEPRYKDFVPDPYGMQQLEWASNILGVRPVFNFTEFYNKYDHDVEGYSKRLVDEYLERVLLCSEADAVREFWEVT